MRDKYYGLAFARTVMFTDDINSFLNRLDYMVDLVNASFAGILEEMFKTFLHYSEEKYLTNEGKGNIYMFMHHVNRMDLSYMARHMYSEYYNRILIMLNGSKCDENIDEFYQHEMAVRRNKDVNHINPNKIAKHKEGLRKSIVYDSEVLFTHLDEEEREFEGKIVPFIASPYYLESVRCLTSLEPELLADANFKGRLYRVLEEHQNLGIKYGVFASRFSLNKGDKFTKIIIRRKSAKKLYKKIKEEQKWT